MAFELDDVGLRDEVGRRLFLRILFMRGRESILTDKVPDFSGRQSQAFCRLFNAEHVNSLLCLLREVKGQFQTRGRLGTGKYAGARAGGDRYQSPHSPSQY